MADKLENLWDQLFGEVGGAMGDIREKLVEEAWFGRSLTDGPKAASRFAQEMGWVEQGAELDEHKAEAEIGPDLDR